MQPAASVAAACAHLSDSWDPGWGTEKDEQAAGSAACTEWLQNREWGAQRRSSSVHTECDDGAFGRKSCAVRCAAARTSSAAAH